MMLCLKLWLPCPQIADRLSGSDSCLSKLEEIGVLKLACCLLILSVEKRVSNDMRQ